MKRRSLTFRETKNGHDRTVPMTPALAEALQALPRPLDPSAFARHAQRVGVQGATFHDLRHDAAPVPSAGVSQRAVMELLGHRDPRMTVRYQHLAPGHLRDAVQALQRATQSKAVTPADAEAHA
jgi:integrase